MARKATVAAGVVGSVLAAAGAWTLYQRATTETVPYTVVATVEDVELRRYPELVTVETAADSTNAAFGRLFRCIGGANDGQTEIAMTAPVELDGGVSISMTAPVEVGPPAGVTGPIVDDGAATPSEDGGRTRMAFHLPEDYDIESAPTPTDDGVELVAVPERTLAVRRFSGRPTDGRIDRERERLLDTLDGAGVAVEGRPFFMGYDAPWTLPFLRRNEVAVEVSD